MSSVVRSNPSSSEPKTKFVPILSLSYNNPNYNGSGINHYVLLPFTYSNGVLDMNANLTGFVPADGQGDDNGFSWRMVKAMGGEGLVNKLGPTFLTWFEAYVEDYVSNPISNIKLEIAPVMTKVQMSVPYAGSILNSQYCFRADLDEAPSSDQFITGNSVSNFDTVWVFKTPLVISYTDGGNKKYASLYTQFTNPN